MYDAYGTHDRLAEVVLLYVWCLWHTWQTGWGCITLCMMLMAHMTDWLRLYYFMYDDYGTHDRLAEVVLLYVWCLWHTWQTGWGCITLCMMLMAHMTDWLRLYYFMYDAYGTHDRLAEVVLLYVWCLWHTWQTGWGCITLCMMLMAHMTDWLRLYYFMYDAYGTHDRLAEVVLLYVWRLWHTWQTGWGCITLCMMLMAHMTDWLRLYYFMYDDYGTHDRLAEVVLLYVWCLWHTWQTGWGCITLCMMLMAHMTDWLRLYYFMYDAYGTHDRLAEVVLLYVWCLWHTWQTGWVCITLCMTLMAHMTDWLRLYYFMYVAYGTHDRLAEVVLLYVWCLWHTWQTGWGCITLCMMLMAHMTDWLRLYYFMYDAYGTHDRLAEFVLLYVWRLWHTWQTGWGCITLCMMLMAHMTDWLRLYYFMYDAYGTHDRLAEFVLLYVWRLWHTWQTVWGCITLCMLLMAHMTDWLRLYYFMYDAYGTHDRLAEAVLLYVWCLWHTWQTGWGCITLCMMLMAHMTDWLSLYYFMYDAYGTHDRLAEVVLLLSLGFCF